MKRIVICLSLLSFAVGGNAWACGDKMVQIGRGVRYQRANAVRPATIMMVLGPRFDRDVAKRLRSELVLVGYKVQILDDNAAFAPTIEAKHFDIVLTDVNNLSAVTERVDAMASRTTVIPVMERSDAAAEVQRRFPVVLLLPSRGLDQIALISQAMK
jgi:hypothetical protein